MCVCVAALFDLTVAGLLVVLSGLLLLDRAYTSSLSLRSNDISCGDLSDDDGMTVNWLLEAAPWMVSQMRVWR